MNHEIKSVGIFAEQSKWPKELTTYIQNNPELLIQVNYQQDNHFSVTNINAGIKELETIYDICAKNDAIRCQRYVLESENTIPNYNELKSIQIYAKQTNWPAQLTEYIQNNPKLHTQVKYQADKKVTSINAVPNDIQNMDKILLLLNHDNKIEIARFPNEIENTFPPKIPIKEIWLYDKESPGANSIKTNSLEVANTFLREKAKTIEANDEKSYRIVLEWENGSIHQGNITLTPPDAKRYYTIESQITNDLKTQAGLHRPTNWTHYKWDDHVSKIDAKQKEVITKFLENGEGLDFKNPYIECIQFEITEYTRCNEPLHLVRDKWLNHQNELIQHDCNQDTCRYIKEALNSLLPEITITINNEYVNNHGQPSDYHYKIAPRINGEKENLEHLLQSYVPIENLQKNLEILIAKTHYLATAIEWTDEKLNPILKPIETEIKACNLYRQKQADANIVKSLLKDGCSKEEIATLLTKHSPNRPSRTDEARTFAEIVIRKAKNEIKKDSPSKDIPR